MNLKPVLPLLILLAFGRPVAAQQAPGPGAVTGKLTQTVRGTITDASTGLPLPGATVVLVGSQPLLGTVTDAEGLFRLPGVPVGRHTLQVRMMGYKEQTMPDVLVSSGKQTELTVKIEESLATAQEVEVRATRNLALGTDEMNVVSARSFSPEEMLRYAGTVSDPARMATVFPGVQGDPSGNNDLIIRGNSPRGVLWRMEGAEMPNPNHFGSEGSSGGAISMLNPNTLRTSDFLTGAFPAQYGNATSGVFDLGLRKGNPDKREYTAQIGTLGIEAQAEGPLNKPADGKPAGSYLANYRYSTLSLLNAAGIKVSGDASPTFQDGMFKIWLPTRKAGTFTLYGMGGYNTVTDKETDQEQRQRETFAGARSMWTAGLKHALPLGAGLNLESQINTSGTTATGQADGNPRGPADPYVRLEETNNTYTNLRLISTLYGKVSARHSFRVGLIGSLMGFKVNTSTFNWDDYAVRPLYNNQGSTGMMQSFVAWQYRPTESLTLNGGLHHTYFSLSRQSIVEPRFSAAWQAAPRHSFSLGAGLHSRVDPVSLYYARVQQADGSFAQDNRNLKLQRALHLVGGYNFAIAPGLNLKAEAYFQHLFSVPIGVDTNAYYSFLNESNVYVDQKLVNKGRGRNYGVDFGLDRTFSNGWYASFSQSVFRSEFENPGYGWKPSRYDNRFVSNVLGGKEFALRSRKGRQRTLVANVRLVYTGGIRYTPLDLARSQAEGHSVYDNTRYNDKRAPNFTRIDASIGLRTNRAKSTHTLKLDVMNALNQQVVVGEYYDAYRREVQHPYSVGIVPNLSYRIEF